MSMLEAARPLVKKVKLSTGIPGLKVIRNSREVLIDLYTQMLREVKAVKPCNEYDHYGSATKAMAKSRLKVCKSQTDWEAIEKSLGYGQMEELIDWARYDLAVLRRIVEGKPWKIKL